MRQLQIHPTMECNRRCDFCSYQNTNRSHELSFDFIDKCLGQAIPFGFDELRLSGGGEPLLHKKILSIVLIAKYYQMKVSLQTNGDMLTTTIRRFVDDIRVSCGDNCRLVKSPLADGFNYVVTSKPEYEKLNNLILYAHKNKKYVRIIQDETDIENVPDIATIQDHITAYENITFWDGKQYHSGSNPCPSKSPLLGATGYWYPCCRTQYAKGKHLLTYDETMRCENIQETLSYDGSVCVRCYYGD